MIRRWVRHLTPSLAGVCASLILTAIFYIAPLSWTERVTAPIQDLLLESVSRIFANKVQEDPPSLTVIAIDERSIRELGPWPWPRERLAALVEHAIASGAKVVAIDVLFDGPDTSSPAAVARQLGSMLGSTDFTVLAKGLVDGDDALAKVANVHPVALALALHPDKKGIMPSTAMLFRDPVDLSAVWTTAGVVGPPANVAHLAWGLGVAALPGDAAGVVRKAPMLAVAGGRVYPSLFLEALRLKEGAKSYILSGSPRQIDVGAISRFLPNDGMLRLAPPNEHSQIRMVSAAELFTDAVQPDRFKDGVVFVGATAPEAGGLRVTSNGSLTPSVVLHASAFAQLERGFIPSAGRHVTEIAAAISLLVSGIAVCLALWLRPILALSFIVLAAVIVIGGAVALLAHFQLLFDPLQPIVTSTVGFLATSLTSFANTQQEAARLQQSFEQHLSPSVVRKIVANPELLKLRGERRDITALFTDIEGFTSLTEQLGAEQLVQLLDSYFEGVTTIIISHGGTIDKIVGDAVHAFFNAPLDQNEHWRHAIECASEIERWTENFRNNKVFNAAGLGLTRIGIEAGEAIVGDIGIGLKLDYTAHGSSINAAARLEAANKVFGSKICIGPVAAERYGLEKLRPLGSLNLRGMENDVSCFSLWPNHISDEWKRHYCEAFAMLPSDKARAYDVFRVLKREQPTDKILAVLLDSI